MSNGSLGDEDKGDNYSRGPKAPRQNEGWEHACLQCQCRRHPGSQELGILFLHSPALPCSVLLACHKTLILLFLFIINIYGSCGGPSLPDPPLLVLLTLILR